MSTSDAKIVLIVFVVQVWGCGACWLACSSCLIAVQWAWAFVDAGAIHFVAERDRVGWAHVDTSPSRVIGKCS